MDNGQLISSYACLTGMFRLSSLQRYHTLGPGIMVGISLSNSQAGQAKEYDFRNLTQAFIAVNHITVFCPLVPCCRTSAKVRRVIKRAACGVQLKRQSILLAKFPPFSSSLPPPVDASRESPAALTKIKEGNIIYRARLKGGSHSPGCVSAACKAVKQ